MLINSKSNTSPQISRADPRDSEPAIRARSHCCEELLKARQNAAEKLRMGSDVLRDEQVAQSEVIEQVEEFDDNGSDIQLYLPPPQAVNKLHKRIRHGIKLQIVSRVFYPGWAVRLRAGDTPPQ